MYQYFIGHIALNLIKAEKQLRSALRSNDLRQAGAMYYLEFSR